MSTFNSSTGRRPFARQCIAALAALVLAAKAVADPADVIDLSETPLFMRSSVAANVLLTADDSGSMAYANIPGALDYLVTPGFTDPRYCGFMWPYYYSSRINRIYFDPNREYQPPLRADGTRFPDANFSAAFVDGYAARTWAAGRIPAVNLASEYRPTLKLDINRSEYSGAVSSIVHSTVSAVDVLPAAAPAPGEELRDFCERLKSEHRAVAVLPFPTEDGASEAFYYDYSGDCPDCLGPLDRYALGNYTARRVSAEQRQNFANWYEYYRTRRHVLVAALSNFFGSISSEVRFAWQNLNRNHAVASATDFIALNAVKPDLFDWLYTFNVQAETPLRAASMRAGEVFSASGQTGPYWDQTLGFELSCRRNFHFLITDGFWNETNPSFDGLRTENPIGGGFPAGGVQLDGQAYAGTGGDRPSTIFWNEETGGADPSLADIAFSYWARDLRPDLADNVPRSLLDLTTGITGPVAELETLEQVLGNREVYFNPKNDVANWQHMVTLGVSLGQEGRLATSQYDQLRLGTRRWPRPMNKTSSGIDDLWHSAVASRGRFTLARDVDELSTALEDLFALASSERGSGAAYTSSSGILGNGALALRGGFEAVGWEGYLEAVAIGADGSIGEVAHWNAADLLDAADWTRRRIWTLGAERVPARFDWDRLPDAARDLLAAEFDDREGTDWGRKRTDYLRGDRSSEGDDEGLAIRAGRLGAIIHSAVVVVDAPAGDFRDEAFPEGSPERAAHAAGAGYTAFVNAYRMRPRVAWVGANDGMVHGFDLGKGDQPGTGEEIAAYLPRCAISKSVERAHGAGFEAGVDSTPTIRDVFTDGRWRTLMVGGLRAGGQCFYAFDITDPTSLASGQPPELAWEFTDKNDAELGFSYSKANIARIAAGWVALLPSGYNSHADSDADIGSGRSALFVVDVRDGRLLRRIDVADSHGLSFATSVNLDGDGVDELACAGDLEGRIHCFDLSAADPNQWQAYKVYEPATPGEHPVTSGVRIFASTADPGKLTLAFGSGSLLSTSDRVDRRRQRLNAIRIDPDLASAGIVEQDDLIVRVLERQTLADGTELFMLADSEPMPDGAEGWTLLLPEDGERVVTLPHADFSSGTVIFFTVVPDSGDPCLGGMRGGVFVLDPEDGLAAGLSIQTDSDAGPGQIDAAGVRTDTGFLEGMPTFMTEPGGGPSNAPDLPGVTIAGPTWRRRAWGEK